MDNTKSLPLHKIHVRKREMTANRLHIFIQGIALLALFYYRATTLSRIIQTKESPIIPYILIFGSEIFLTFMWFLHRPAKWRPVKRTPYPERLPGDEKLPRIDVFVCTTDPSKEPSLGVMNTVISAMALDYPTKKIAVYLSDDGGSYVTYEAMKEAWKFAKWWIPFCKKYDVKVRCPEGYFTTAESSFGEFTSSKEYLEDHKEIEERYDEFKEALEKNSVNASSSVSREHPPKIEVINNANGNKWEVINNSSGSSSDSDNNEEMPLLVYVAREKKPSQFHNFKAGAINVLLRVSAIISNAPYFLVLDCDHYCSDPTSARQAMCFYVDPEISPKLAWVQFPQNFHSISDHDIYDGRLHYYWLGFRYFSVVEDTMTSLILHTKGWISVLVDPARKCFLGSCTTSLNDMLVQQTRWSFGLMQIALSKVSPLIYGPLKMSPLQSIFYGSISMDPLYVVPFYGLALIPQICLFYGVPLYPKVSDPFFFVFAFVFLNAQFKFLHDIISNDDPIRTWLYEYRVWMMKSGACYFYATLNAILDKIGMNEADFSLTNKDIDNEQAQRYEKGIYDFQVSARLLAPLCSLYIVNVVAFVIGISRIFCCHSANDLFAQAFISLFGIIVNTHLLEGMIFRQDKGRVSSSISLTSAMISAIILGFGSLIFVY
ncbi:hypothetical protein RD792_006313 [Penstemon davidsonii]|uniref:Uncharacterized protein n=1 Tax=Penstemon davidsonii TaxID=160366 RepID=A0ABR0DE30_9LAMI|nr:hypothetical protein RD792_006313 [Penstemon davidsonii]